MKYAMKSYNILILSLTILTTSCVEYKLITKGNYLTKVTKRSGADDEVTDKQEVFKVESNVFAKIDNKNDYLVISDINPGGLKLLPDTTSPEEVSGFQASLNGKYYNSDNRKDIIDFYYWEGKPVLQGIATVVKIRPKLDNYALQDSFPTQVETGFSPALSLGWKFSRNKFSKNKDIFGRNVRQISFTPGLLLGVGAVDLTKANTRAPKIEFPRKALFISRGGFFSLGYNNINLGYAWGKDYATGKGSDGWLYKGETWHGIIFGFDIIK